jgi:hypothetical protein
MSNNKTDPNNKLYDDIIGYKYDKSCIGVNCKQRNTNLFQMSLTIGYSFLCDDCKRSIEYDGWILNVIADTNDLRKISKRMV